MFSLEENDVLVGKETYASDLEATGTPAPDDLKMLSYNPMAAKGKVIYTSTCRCGGGKTETMMNNLADDYTTGSRVGLTIVASITNKLGEQTWEGLYGRLTESGALLDKENGFHGYVHCELVNSSEMSKYTGVVVMSMVDMLKQIQEAEEDGTAPPYNGIMITSHKSLLDIPPKLYAYADIIIDEIPSEFTEFLDVVASPLLHKSFTGGEGFEGWCNYTPYNKGMDPDDFFTTYGIAEFAEGQGVSVQEYYEKKISELPADDPEYAKRVKWMKTQIQKADSYAVSESTGFTADGEDVEQFKPDTAVEMVRLKNKFRFDALDLVVASRKKAYTDLTDETVSVIEGLMFGFDLMVLKTITKEAQYGGVEYHYQGISTWKMYKVCRYSKSLTIMAASLEDSVAYPIMKERFGLKFQDITPDLLKKHNNKFKIIPYLKQGEWSKDVRLGRMCEKLNGETSQEIVVVDFMKWVHDEFGGKDYLLFANDDNRYAGSRKGVHNPCYKPGDVGEGSKTNIQELTTSIHGMNNLRDYTQAAFTASLRPTPDERNAYYRYAHFNGMDGQKLVNHVEMERYYEAAYQCGMRMAIRQPWDYNTGGLNDKADECVFFVPDMKITDYITKRFEPGCITVDKTNSRERAAQTQIKREQDEKEEMCLLYYTLVQRDKEEAAKVGKNKLKTKEELQREAGYTGSRGGMAKAVCLMTNKEDYKGRIFRQKLIDMGLMEDDML